MKNISYDFYFIYTKSNIFIDLNKFKIGDLPIGIANKIELALYKSDAEHRHMINYFSPEIITIKQSDLQKYFFNEILTHKADIWSLGCVFFEVLTLRKRFECQKTNQLCQEISNNFFSEEMAKSFKENNQRSMKIILEK